MMDMTGRQYSPAPEALLLDRLRAAAWTNVVLHVLGLVAAVVWMRPGTAAHPLASRMAYLATTPGGWRLGWCVWALCALTLLAFLGVLAASRPGPSTQAAFSIACAAAAVDLTCDTLFAVVLPRAASAGSAETFLLLERGINAASLTVANGLYSVAVLVASRGVDVTGVAEARQRTLAVATFVAGLVLAAGGLTGDPRHVELATGPTLGLFMAWTLVVARAAPAARA
jgi:hypothetical protein